MTAAGPRTSDLVERRHVDAVLRRVSCPGFGSTASVVDPASPTLASGLDERTDALVRLAALMAMRGSGPCYRSAVEAALASGATVEEMIGTMIAVAPTVGLSRLVPAGVGLALALGYDVDAELECLDDRSDLRHQPEPHR